MSSLPILAWCVSLAATGDRDGMVPAPAAGRPGLQHASSPSRLLRRQTDPQYRGQQQPASRPPQQVPKPAPQIPKPSPPPPSEGPRIRPAPSERERVQLPRPVIPRPNVPDRDEGDRPDRNLRSRPGRDGERTDLPRPGTRDRNRELRDRRPRGDADDDAGKIDVPGHLFGNDGRPDVVPDDRSDARRDQSHAGPGRSGGYRVPRTVLPRERSEDRDHDWSWRDDDRWRRDQDRFAYRHHVHFGQDPWFRCGSHFGLSWGFVFCDDPWDRWTWCYRFRDRYPVYVYYPYPYPQYSYVDLGYIDEAAAYPPLPAESYIDAEASFDTLLGRADDLFRKGDYISATEAYRQSLLKDLTNAPVRFAYARALFAIGNYPFAALAIRMGMKLAPDWPMRGTDLRDAYGHLDDFATQLAALEYYGNERPDDPAALLVAGYVHHFAGDPDRAAQEFERLVDLDANDWVARAFVSVSSVVPPPAGR